MFHPIELFVGLRYTRAKRRNHFISFIALTSVMGIVLGVTALITVMSVMNGFEKEVRERILGMAAHAIISSSGESLQDWRGLEKVAVKYPGVTGAAPFVEGQAMVNFGGQVSGAQIRGIDPAMEPKVSEVGTKMVSGNLDALQPGSFEVILGRELANSLGVGVGDKLTVITPQATVTLAGILPRIKRFTVSGIFEVGMYEYDRSVALINMQDAALLFNLGDGITGVRLKLADMDQAPSLARTLQAELPSGTLVTDWTRLHANYFSAVQQEKRVMFIILTLIIAVAMF
ncbi:MAG: lipoprotein-releasing system transrane subunit LolC, partial [Proteobacteria bacterium]|nr:lipoprotein-releasing system transrane subunit LolC [Pseudomonadota bacterium]